MTDYQNERFAMLNWIEDMWPGYHDCCSDDRLISFFNNENELTRLNNHRNENTPMKWFNLMLAKALLERNDI